MDHQQLKRSNPLNIRFLNLCIGSTNDVLALRPVDCNVHGVGRLQNVPGLGNLVRRAVSQKEELVGLQRCLVFHQTALNPPTTTAPSSAPMIQATNGPATNIVPKPGMTKKAAPNSIPQIPPQKAPSLPQYFILSPVF